MSNFLTSNNSKSRVAKLIYRELFCKGDTMGRKLSYDNKLKTITRFTLDNITKKNLTIENADTEILKILEDMNQHAVNNRYNEKDKTEHKTMEKITMEQAYDYQTFKSLQCFLYNADNDKTIKKYYRIFNYLRELEKDFAIYLVQGTENFKNAQWN